MGKFICCVPGCTNNWRNSPNMKFHTLPTEPKVKRTYVRLIRNATLKKDAPTTRVHRGAHFPNRVRMSRNELPSIFPWTTIPKNRRVLKKTQLPSKGKKMRSQQREKDLVLDSNECEKLEEDKKNAVHVNFDKKIRKDQACQVETKVCGKDQGCQMEGVNELKHLRIELATLKTEIKSLRQCH